MVRAIHAGKRRQHGAMTMYSRSRLSLHAPELERVLTRSGEHLPAALYSASQIRCETVSMTMRDGVRLATDLYLPPCRPAPCIAVRAPYGRAVDSLVGAFMSFARRGYVVISQDCRGTGDSEPDSWDYYMYEPDDGYDLAEWVSKQEWFDGFLGSCGGSYVGQTQWCMAMHPRMSTIVPQVSGLGIAINTVHLYMFANAYARSVGKGADKVPIHYTEMERAMEQETMAGGFFNEPLHIQFSGELLKIYPELSGMPPNEAKRWLWEKYCSLSCAHRAELVRKALGATSVSIVEVEALPAIFGRQISHDAHTLPHPNPTQLVHQLHAPPLMITGWYDWGLNDALATWQLLRRSATGAVSSRSRLIIAPSAHNMPGYHERMAEHPELQSNHRMPNNLGVLLNWYASMRAGTIDAWPTVIYYLMGANEWHVTDDWPPPNARTARMYLGANRSLSEQTPEGFSEPDRYTYDPNDPTPTVGGSIVSYVYLPGSVDVSGVQGRHDMLIYTTAPLENGIDVVGPIRLILYASSTAVDTDFSARLSDVFPDGRSVQLQSGMLRARYRNLNGGPELLEPDCVYRLEIDMWATANRFDRGHRLRLDISSADFPRFDRNTNRGGVPGEPVVARQTIYHDLEHPSQLILSVLEQ